jgi:acetylornithine/succinyldiaminopimelate/putrescine aminotransferase
MHQLQQTFPDEILDVRGAGFMLGLQVSRSPMDVLKNLQQNGIIALPCGHDTVRFLPPLVIQKEHVDELVTVLTQIFK